MLDLYFDKNKHLTNVLLNVKKDDDNIVFNFDDLENELKLLKLNTDVKNLKTPSEIHKTKNLIIEKRASSIFTKKESDNLLHVRIKRFKEISKRLFGVGDDYSNTLKKLSLSFNNFNRNIPPFKSNNLDVISVLTKVYFYDKIAKNLAYSKYIQFNILVNIGSNRPDLDNPLWERLLLSNKLRVQNDLGELYKSKEIITNLHFRKLIITIDSYVKRNMNQDNYNCYVKLFHIVPAYRIISPEISTGNDIDFIQKNYSYNFHSTYYSYDNYVNLDLLRFNKQCFLVNYEQCFIYLNDDLNEFVEDILKIKKKEKLIQKHPTNNLIKVKDFPEVYNYFYKKTQKDKNEVNDYLLNIFLFYYFSLYSIKKSLQDVGFIFNKKTNINYYSGKSIRFGVVYDSIRNNNLALNFVKISSRNMYKHILKKYNKRVTDSISYLHRIKNFKF